MTAPDPFDLAAAPADPAGRTAAEWAALARAAAAPAERGVYALYAGTNAHAEGRARTDNPFNAGIEAELTDKWDFGWRTAERAQRDRDEAAAPPRPDPGPPIAAPELGDTQEAERPAPWWDR